MSPELSMATDKGDLEEVPVPEANFFVKYYQSTVRNFLFLFSGLLSLIAPVVNLFLLVGWFILFFGLFFVGLFAKILDLMGAGNLLRHFSKSFANGETLVQWNALSLYDDKSEVDFKSLEDVSSSPNYQTPIAKSLLLFSGLVYEDLTFIDQKAKDWNWKLEKAIYGPGKSAAVQIFSSIAQDKSELKTSSSRYSNSGAVAPKSGTIVVVFRGTNPINFNEWLVDINLLQTDGRPYLSGQIHDGFFNRLFKRHSRTAQQENTYVAVINKLNSIAQEVNNDESAGPPLNLWVTGHSLGAALATLFYTRLLQSKDDLRGIKLAGAYTFGCPRTGNYNFVMDALTKENKIIENNSNRHYIWRVVNANDIVPRVPFGLGLLPETLRHKLSGGLLDYYHFGKRVQLHYVVDPHLEPDSFFKQIGGLFHLLSDYLWHYTWLFYVYRALNSKKWATALSWFFLPFFIADHTPAAYFRNLEHMASS